MYPRTTRRAVLLAAVASAGCLGRARAPLTVHTDLSGRPFRYHDRCCDWEGTTITGFLPAVLDALGSAIAQPVELITDSETGAVRCSMGPPEAGSLALLGGFYTVVLPPEGPPTRVQIPTQLDGAAVLEALAGVTDATPQPVREPPSPPTTGRAVVTDWVTAYRWAHRGHGRLVETTPTSAGAFEATVLAVAPAGVTLAAEDPTLGTELADGVGRLRRAGQLSAIREEYFTAAGRPRRL